MATTNLGTLVVQFEAKFAQFSKGIKSVESQLQSAAGAARGAAIAFGAAFAGGAAIAAKSAKTFANFQAEMARVGAVSRASAEDLGMLSDRAVELAKATEFTATQAAGAMQAFALAGFEVSEIMEATGPTLKLASVGMLDVKDAAEISAAAMRTFGLETKDLSFINNVLAKTATSTMTTISELGAGLKFVGPVAANLGLTFDQVTAAMGQLAQQNIRGEMAGTALRNIMLDLGKASKGNAARLKDLGITVLNTSGKFVGFTSLLKQFEKSGAQSEEIIRLFGKRSLPAFNILLGQGSGKLSEFTKAVKAAGDAGTLTDDIYAELGRTLKFQTQIFNSQIEAAQINIGKVLEPALSALVKTLSSVVNAFNELSPAVQEFIVKGGIAITVGLGAAAMVAALTAALIPAAIAFVTMGVAVAGPIALIPIFVGLLGAAVAAAVLLESKISDKIDTLKENFETFGAVVEVVFEGLKTTLLTILGPIGIVLNAIRSAIRAVQLLTSIGDDEKIGGGLFDDPEGKKGGAKVAAADAASKKMEDLQNEINQNLGSVARGGRTMAQVLDDFNNATAGVSEEAKKASEKMKRALEEARRKRAEAEQALTDKLTEMIPSFGTFASALADLPTVTENLARGGAAPGQKRTSLIDIDQIIADRLSKRQVNEDLITKDLQLIDAQLQARAEEAERLDPTNVLIRGAENFASKVVDNLGTAGEAIKAGMQGFAEGGPLGAVIGVITVMLTSLESFQTLMTALSSIFDALLDAISPLLDGLVVVVQTIAKSLAPLFASLRPVFEALGKGLAALAAPLGRAAEIATKTLVPIIEALTPFIDILVTMFTVMTQIATLFNPLLFAFEVLGFVMGALSDVINEVTKFFSDIAKGIEQFVGDVKKEIFFFLQGIGITIGDLVKGAFGPEIRAAADAIAKTTLEGNRTIEEANKEFRQTAASMFATEEQMRQGLDAISAAFATAEQMQVAQSAMTEDATESASEAMEDLAKTVNDVNEALTNTPQGFKIALERFRATEGAALGDGETGFAGVAGTVQIFSNSPGEIARAIKNENDFAGFATSAGSATQTGQFTTGRKGS